MSDNSWLKKYKPKTLDDIVCNKKGAIQIIKWIKNFNKNKKKVLNLMKANKTNNKKKRGRGKRRLINDPTCSSSLLVIGDHGTGKTMIVETVLKCLGYTIIYPDFSNLKGTSSIEKYINNILKSNDVLNLMENSDKRKIFRKEAIIIDEIESISSRTMKKFVLALQKENSIYWKYPIVFISNGEHAQPQTDLRKCSYVVMFWPPYNSDIKKILIKIVTLEKLNIKDHRVLDKILDYSQSDIRKLINTLYDLYNIHETDPITYSKIDQYMNVTQKKDRNIHLYAATEELLYKYENINTCLKYYSMNKSALPLMIHQHYIDNVIRNQNKSIALKKLSIISDLLSTGDIVDSYIYSSCNWDMQELHGIYTCAITSHEMKPRYKNVYTKIKIGYAMDFNKTSTKHINKKNIHKTDKCFDNMNIMDYLYMSKILNKLIKEDEIKQCVQWMICYDIKIEHIESLLKIDKIKNIKYKLPPKYKKKFEKYIKKYKQH